MPTVGIGCQYTHPWTCIHSTDDHSRFEFEQSKMVIGYLPDGLQTPQVAVDRWLSGLPSVPDSNEEELEEGDVVESVRFDVFKRKVRGLHGQEWGFERGEELGTTVAWRVGEGCFVASVVAPWHRYSDHRGVLERVLASGEWGREPEPEQEQEQEPVPVPVPVQEPEPVQDQASLVLATRAELGLSRTDFGRLLGAQARTVLKWEQGSSIPSAENVSMMETMRLAMANQKHLDVPALLKISPRYAFYVLIRAAFDKAGNERVDVIDLERRVKVLEKTLAEVSAPFE